MVVGWRREKPGAFFPLPCFHIYKHTKERLRLSDACINAGFFCARVALREKCHLLDGGRAGGRRQKNTFHIKKLHTLMMPSEQERERETLCLYIYKRGTRTLCVFAHQHNTAAYIWRWKQMEWWRWKVLFLRASKFERPNLSSLECRRAISRLFCVRRRINSLARIASALICTEYTAVVRARSGWRRLFESYGPETCWCVWQWNTYIN